MPAVPAGAGHRAKEQARTIVGYDGLFAEYCREGAEKAEREGSCRRTRLLATLPKLTAMLIDGAVTPS